ncbi:MAG: DUF6448 family protein [Planctomycetota bacterium]|jgi:hypothetical protein
MNPADLPPLSKAVLATIADAGFVVGLGRDGEVVVVTATDQALEQGNVDELAKRIGDLAEAGVRERFARAIKAKEHANHNREAGREFVETYVVFVHYVQGLHNTIAGHGSHHAESEAEEHTETKASGGCGHDH